MFDQEDGNRKVFTSVFLWVSVQAPNTVIESPRLPSRASGYNGNVIVVKGDGGWLIFVFWRKKKEKKNNTILRSSEMPIFNNIKQNLKICEDSL